MLKRQRTIFSGLVALVAAALWLWAPVAHAGVIITDGRVAATAPTTATNVDTGSSGGTANAASSSGAGTTSQHHALSRQEQLLYLYVSLILHSRPAASSGTNTPAPPPPSANIIAPQDGPAGANAGGCDATGSTSPLLGLGVLLLVAWRRRGR